MTTFSDLCLKAACFFDKIAGYGILLFFWAFTTAGFFWVLSKLTK